MSESNHMHFGGQGVANRAVLVYEDQRERILLDLMNEAREHPDQLRELIQQASAKLAKLKH